MLRGGPQAVFFDVGNTLLFPYPSVSHVCAEILRDAGHVRDLDAIESLMPLVDQYYEDRYRDDDAFWTSEQETSGVWVGMYSLLCRELGIEERAEELAMAVYDAFGSAERWRAWDDVRPAFERLRDRGVRVGVISNWDRRLPGLLEGLGLTDIVEVVVSSADVGLRKPDPRIFEMACERLGVQAGRSAHVGDHVYADVLGARTAGLAPVLIDRRGGTPVPPATPVIATLDDLDRVLEEGAGGA
jgi:putative hydrolase of the HAD superfamily